MMLESRNSYGWGYVGNYGKYEAVVTFDDAIAKENIKKSNMPEWWVNKYVNSIIAGEGYTKKSAIREARRWLEEIHRTGTIAVRKQRVGFEY